MGKISLPIQRAAIGRTWGPNGSASGSETWTSVLCLRLVDPVNHDKVRRAPHWWLEH